jgi:hypothetical protein
MDSNTGLACVNCGRSIGSDEVFHHAGAALCAACYQSNVPPWSRSAGAGTPPSTGDLTSSAPYLSKGYFNALTASSFRHDGANWVFYPWGVLRRGFVIPSEAEHLRLRRFVRTYILVGLVAVFVVGRVAGYSWVAAAVGAFTIFYFVRVRAFTAGLAESATRLTVRDSLQAQGALHRRWFLWTLGAMSGLFTAIGLLCIVILPDDRLTSVGIAVFFGFCTWRILRMLRLQKRHESDKVRRPSATA